ncbi:uncharacterized protein TNCV_3353771 [Trichonephila clavipes]|nr:uncharacterized protein TNCV_3353771 [Trichonephila clavipes]
MGVNSHLPIHNRFYGFTSWSKTRTTPIDCPWIFMINQLGSDQYTWPWGHCLLSELREWRQQTGHHNGLKEFGAPLTIGEAYLKIIMRGRGKRDKRVRERERTEGREKRSEKRRAGRLRKRRGESQSFLIRDAVQESKTRKRNNALWTGRRQAMELRKGDLLEVARELGVEVNGDQTKVEIKDMILQNDKNDMETIKAVMEGILEEKEREFEERRQIREFELERMRIQLRNKLNENKLKAENRINDLANVCILSGKRTAEVSEPVNKCRPLINPVVNKSVENATSCDFEKKNCDPQ